MTTNDLRQKRSRRLVRTGVEYGEGLIDVSGGAYEECRVSIHPPTKYDPEFVQSIADYLKTQKEIAFAQVAVVSQQLLVPDGGRVLMGGTDREPEAAPLTIPPGDIRVDAYAGRGLWNSQDKEVFKLMDSMKSMKGVTVQVHEDGTGDAFTQAIVHDPAPVAAEPAENQKREEQLLTNKIAIDEVLRAHKVPRIRWLNSSGIGQEGPVSTGQPQQSGSDGEKARTAALDELKLIRTAPSLVRLLELNGDKTSHIEKLGNPTNYGGVTDVDEIHSAGKDYVAVAARRFPPKNITILGNAGVGMIFLFDKSGNLVAKFGGPVGDPGPDDPDVRTQLLTLGTEDRWFAEENTSLRGNGKLKRVQKIFLIEDGIPLAMQVEVIEKSMAWTAKPYREFDYGFEHFFMPHGSPDRELGKGLDGKNYYGVLGWDTTQQVFRGPSQFTYQDKLIFQVSLDASKRFQAMDVAPAAMEKVSGIEQPLDRKNASAVVKAWVAAVIAKDVTRASSLAQNLPARADQIEAWGNNWILSGFSIGTAETAYPQNAPPRVLFVSSEQVRTIRPVIGQPAASFLAFSLEQKDDAWFVTDICPFDTVEKAAEHFLNPDADVLPQSSELPTLREAKGRPQVELEPKEESENDETPPLPGSGGSAPMEQPEGDSSSAQGQTGRREQAARAAASAA